MRHLQWLGTKEEEEEEKERGKDIEKYLVEFLNRS
jgi:hypothetical protein